MTQTQDMETKIAVLEARVEDLQDRLDNPPKPGFWERMLSWDMAKNVIWVFGIPAALFGAWHTINTEILSASEIKKRELLGRAVENVGELQAYNSRIFQLQAAQDAGASFAIQEAERGRIERLTKDLFEFWSAYPEEFTRSEKTTLVEALIGQEETDKALAVLQTVDQSGMNNVWLGDMDILKARVLFATGPARNFDAAREAFKDAMRHAQEIEAVGRQDRLTEKYIGVRLMNELWAGTDCAELAPFKGFFTEKLTEEPLPVGLDAVRDNSVLIMNAYNFRCGDQE